MRLSQLSTGQSAIVVKILGHGAFRKRMIEMGFVKGREVNVLLHAPLKDPIKYSLMGYEVSLRASEASLVEVTPIDQITPPLDSAHDPAHSVIIPDADEQPQNKPSTHPRHIINVALIGNPNCGKTTLFNAASGAHEHVGNYSGVTVDAIRGHLNFRGYHINLVDLPGTYSLAAYSPEELYVRRYLKDETPDVIINVVDASNLERNLYLTTELIDMDHPMVIALNMFDELEKSGSTLDYDTLGQMIGIPIVPTSARQNSGIDHLFETVVKVFEGTHKDVRHIHVNLGVDIEPSITLIKDRLKADPYIPRHFSPRYLAIKLLESDPETESLITSSTPKATEILSLRDSAQQRINTIHPDEPDITALIAAEKYGFIAGALAETMVKSQQQKVDATHIIDTIVTNRLFGFPIFLSIMLFIFWATFQIGSYPMEWIEMAISWLGQLIRNTLPQGILNDLISDGIIGGVGGVIVFLPNILILYACISFMEDSGYMSRAAFIMDKVMHKIGLHGKSFIPLVMGFGCTVPAIIASRSIESRSSRIITILINPFISCSARLPIYVLLAGTFFPSHPTLIFTSLYILGILVAVITARLLRRFHFKTDVTPFVMELPPYRIPTFHATVRHMWGKAEQYLKKMGGIILVASIIVWALNYFPNHNAQPSDQPQNLLTAIDDTKIDPAHDSYLEMMGKAVNPVLQPLGFHWRASVAALAGVPAKEIVVSTLGVLYTGIDTPTDATLGQRLRQPSPITGKPDFDTPTAISFLIFILLYCPCIATITAIIKETGSVRYGIFSIVYNTLVAWITSFIAYRIALLFF